MDAGNPARGAALNGVGSGFVHRLTRGNVIVDLLLRKRQELDACGLGGDQGLSVRSLTRNDGHAGHHVMGSSGELSQHPCGIVGRLWLAQNAPVDDYGGICAEDDDGWLGDAS